MEVLIVHPVWDEKPVIVPVTGMLSPASQVVGVFGVAVYVFNSS